MKKSVKPHKAMKRGIVYWRVIVPPSKANPKRKHRWFRTSERAETFARTISADRGARVEEIYALPYFEQIILVQALKKAGNAHAVLESVNAHAAALARERKLVADVVKMCANAKAAQGCRPAYTRPFQLQLERFARSMPAERMMHEVTRDDVENFVNAPRMRTKGKLRILDGPPSFGTKRARLIDLRTLFSFAIDRGFCSTNIATKVELPRTDEKMPGILYPRHVRKLLETVRDKHPHLIPFVALCLFGGLRPSEAQKLRWEDIREQIHIGADRSKGRRRRVVTVNPTLRAWLDLGGVLPISEARARKVRDLVKPWPKDGLRHSFVSYHFAVHGEAETSREAGHSIDVLHAHYRALVTRKQADVFWGLTPDGLNKPQEDHRNDCAVV